MSLLSIEDLHKRFGGVVVADGITLALEPGARVALIGPNGAGKTSLVDLVCGQLRPDRGRVLLDGQDMTQAAPADRVRAGVVRSFQVTRLFAEQTPAEHVMLAILQRQGRSGRMLTDFRADPAVMAEVAMTLDLLGLAHLAQVRVGDIAYGQQRLLEIALVLALRPRVVLLDEPGAGVPASDIRLIEAALARLPADLAVLMIEHDMEFVFRFAQRVVVLAAGRVIADGAPAAVAADPAVRAAYLGGYAG